MADKDEKPQEQPKGGDHIPTGTQDEGEEDTQPKGLLSKIGDPVGTSSSPRLNTRYFSIPPLLFPFRTLRPSSYPPLTTNHSTGSVLGTALRPIGAPLEKGVTGPLGNAIGGTTRPALGPLMGEDHERSELLGGKNKDSYESKPESIAGKEQTGDNPLGLDQTGRWGFADDEK